MSLLNVCYTRWTRTETRMVFCPTCAGRRKMLCRFQEWYGWTTVCLTCGDSWTDGEMHPRPFARGWRKAAVAAARAALPKRKEARP